MSTQSKYVSALYQTRSFPKAAKLLYISQPALSKVSISKTLNSCHIFHYVHTVICIQEVQRFFIIMMQKQIMPCM